MAPSSIGGRVLRRAQVPTGTVCRHLVAHNEGPDHIDRGPGDGTEPTTLVEFRITDTPGDGVVLSVTESGLSKRPGDDASRRCTSEGSSSGRDEELRVAKGRLDAA